jgi:hypothetical protein
VALAVVREAPVAAAGVRLATLPAVDGQAVLARTKGVAVPEGPARPAAVVARAAGDKPRALSAVVAGVRPKAGSRSGRSGKSSNRLTHQLWVVCGYPKVTVRWLCACGEALR